MTALHCSGTFTGQYDEFYDGLVALTKLAPSLTVTVFDGCETPQDAVDALETVEDCSFQICGPIVRIEVDGLSIGWKVNDLEDYTFFMIDPDEEDLYDFNGCPRRLAESFGWVEDPDDEIDATTEYEPINPYGDDWEAQDELTQHDLDLLMEEIDAFDFDFGGDEDFDLEAVIREGAYCVYVVA